MKRLTALLSAVAVLAAMTAGAAPAMATTTGTLGADVSWPQCPASAGDLPGTASGTPAASFGIVGVNDGKPGATNPCLSTEFNWANSLPNSAQVPQLYVNTADPGNTAADWPTGNTAYANNPYGTCSTVKSRGKIVGEDSQACAFEYGAEQATSDLGFAATAGASTATWWLDVETANTWLSRGLIDLNQADLLGMVDTLASGTVTVGAYSTHYQWNKILGTLTSPAATALNALAQWIPTGGNSESTAAADCTDQTALPSFTNGTRTYVQYTNTFDYDVSCLF